MKKLFYIFLVMATAAAGQVVVPLSDVEGATTMLNARAPRQGLVFDGTVGATVANVPAFGTGDFTVGAWINASALPAATADIVGGGANGFQLALLSSGALEARLIATAAVGTSTTLLAAGKSYFVSYSRNGTTGTFHVNGVAAGSITDSTNYSAAVTKVGTSIEESYFWKGTLHVLIYNRALSAAEVLALYESGTPAASDYNNASNTSLVTGDNSTFASDTGYWTKAGGVTISGGTLHLVSVSHGASAITRAALLTKSAKYRVTYTISNYVAGGVRIEFGGTVGTTRSANGTFTEEVVCGAANTSAYPLVAQGTTTLDVDDLTIVPLGLLFSPNATQPGAGLTWYDTSGNSAHVTLPASGVRWALPWSGTLPGPVTVAGNLTTSGIVGSATSNPFPGALTGDARYNLYANSVGGATLYGRGSTYDITLANKDGNMALNVPTGTTNVGIVSNLTVSGTGPHVFGGAVNNAVQLYLSGAYSPTGSSIGEGLLVGPSLTIAPGNDGNLFRVAGTLIEAGSGTHTNLVGARFDPPTITAGAATTTNASTVKITGAPTGGTNNYALWVSAGDSLLAGNLTVSGTGGISATADAGVTSGEKVLGTFNRGTGATDAGVFIGYRADGTNPISGSIRSANSRSLQLGTTAYPTALTISNADGSTTLASNLSVSGTVSMTRRIIGTAADGVGLPDTNGLWQVGSQAGTGLELIGRGSTNDITVYNSSGNTAFVVPAGTRNLSISGNLNVNGTGAQSLGGTGATVAVAGTSAVKGIRTATAALDFPSIAAGATQDLTITVTGAAVGDDVNVVPAAGGFLGAVALQGCVTSANTVTVRAYNITTGAIDPAATTIRATVTSF